MNWNIILGLLAFGILIAGCAGKGAGGPSTLPGGEIAAPPAEEAPDEEPAPPAGEEVPPADEPTLPAGETPPAEEPPAEHTGDGLGDLFQIDTDEPLEGSGYEVPGVEE